MSKRANGEGTVRQRAGGRWEARLVYTDPNSGQTKRTSFYGPKASEARAKLRAARLRLESGAPVRDAKRTVADWLGHWQRTTLAASSRKETTKVLYRHLISGHIAPAPFGAIPLDRLKPSDVDGLILAMRSKTKPAQGGVTIRALSDATVQRVFTVLRVALDGAVRDGLLARNPAATVRQPAVPHREARFLSSVDVVALLRAAEGSRYRAPLVLIAATGLRKGEALALQWTDIDFEAKSLRVRGTLARGRRGARGERTEDGEVAPIATNVSRVTRHAPGAPEGADRRAPAGGERVDGDGARLHVGVGATAGPAKRATGTDRGCPEGRH